MRITGGKLSGHKVLVPDYQGAGFRPTMDFLREAIYSSLTSRINFSGISVLDLFSGTGIMAFECLSRGADSVISVESNPSLAKGIIANATSLNLMKNIEVICSKVEKVDFAGKNYNLVIADPPYEMFEFYELFKDLYDKNVFAENSCFVFEDRASKIKQLSKQLDMQNLEDFVLLKMKVHGDSGFLILGRNMGKNGKN